MNLRTTGAMRKEDYVLLERVVLLSLILILTACEETVELN